MVQQLSLIVFINTELLKSKVKNVTPSLNESAEKRLSEADYLSCL